MVDDVPPTIPTTKENPQKTVLQEHLITCFVIPELVTPYYINNEDYSLKNLFNNLQWSG